MPRLRKTILWGISVFCVTMLLLIGYKNSSSTALLVILYAFWGIFALMSCVFCVGILGIFQKFKIITPQYKASFLLIFVIPDTIFYAIMILGAFVAKVYILPVFMGVSFLSELIIICKFALD